MFVMICFLKVAMFESLNIIYFCKIEKNNLVKFLEQMDILFSLTVLPKYINATSDNLFRYIESWPVLVLIFKYYL